MSINMKYDLKIVKDLLPERLFRQNPVKRSVRLFHIIYLLN